MIYSQIKRVYVFRVKVFFFFKDTLYLHIYKSQLTQNDYPSVPGFITDHSNYYIISLSTECLEGARFVTRSLQALHKHDSEARSRAHYVGSELKQDEYLAHVSPTTK